MARKSELRRTRDFVTAFGAKRGIGLAREFGCYFGEEETPSWEAVLIRVYRRAGEVTRRAARGRGVRHRGAKYRWRYLGIVACDLEMEGVKPEEIEQATPEGLDAFVPLSHVQQAWGEGHYQFRFFWRLEWGGSSDSGRLISLHRSLNMRIGAPVPNLTGIART